MKLFKRLMASALASAILMTSVAVNTTLVSAAPSLSAGWNETLYAEWADTNPDAANVKVGYRPTGTTAYTYLEGNDLEFLVRKASTAGYGRVDIPGLREGRYDIEITASDGKVHTRNGIKVYAYDRSGYAHFGATEGVGAYNNDGTLKDNAIVVYVTDENKDTFKVPGYENQPDYNYLSSSTGATWTRSCEGIGNLLNNNMKFIQQITLTDNHPLAIRFIGDVTVPKNLTPYDRKDQALGGSSGDNGNLAICKYGRNITLEGIGDDAKINGWGFTFSQTSTCPPEAGKNFEVRNLTFDKYSEDGLGFQGEDGITCPIERVWVHNNVFYPGYCASPAEGDKGEGDGSCDFKRGQYYTMSYNRYVDCHKTNLVGSGTSDDQFYISLHHNWYQNVMSRQPLAANGNMHVYSTYFQNGDTTVDLRGKDCVRLEENYYENCKSIHKSRNATCIAKSYNEIATGGTQKLELKGKRTVVGSLDEKVLTGSSYSFPDGTSIDNFDLDATKFYKDNYFVTPAAEVPEYVQTYGGTLKAFPETESGEIIVTVTADGKAVTDAAVKASGLSFRNNGDGTYSATASLGSEYAITVSKEGYSNQTITSDVITTDGEILKYTANLQADYDGYAVVSLVGGENNTPVKGATVKLADGTVLADQGDGTYKSAEQMALGQYDVTITNTGDYIEPASTQKITVKTTDEATEIHLDVVKGAVSVTLKAAEGETKTFDPAGANVFVGATQLTDSGNGVFTGTVDVGTALDVKATLSGWKIDTITPEKLTATKEGTASAVVTMKALGDAFTWNYTTGTNTDNFFDVSKEGAAPDEWGSAKSNPQTYNGETLTKAIKVQSSTTVVFDAPAEGEVVLVMNAPSGSTVKVNGVVYNVVTGENTIPVPKGEVTIAKGKNETRLFLVQYLANGGSTPSESTTETTTESTTIDTNALNDEIKWDVTANLSGTSNGLTFNEEFFANEDEFEREFVDADGKTYKMIYYVQGKNNPKNAAGVNPQGALSEDPVPVTGSFIKFVPEKNGTFTVAAKTNGGKASYVTDGAGKVITTIGSADINNQLPTSYDIIKTQVTAGETYYVYSGGSNICIYYLGFTSDGTMPPAKLIYGDADNSGMLTSNDAATLLAKSLNNSFVTPLEQAHSNDAFAYLDVNNDTIITADDAANVLSKVLDAGFTFKAEQ